MAYVPILKGKRGEFTALGNVAPAVQAQIRPILEVVPDGRLRDVMETFVQHACDHLPKGLEVTVDCGALRNAGVVGGVFTGHSVTWLSEAFGAWMLPLIPVFRPTDPPEALAEIRDVHRAHHLGASLRIELLDLPPDPSTVVRAVRAALRCVRLAPEQTDLLLDAGHVVGETAVAQAAPAMRQALNWSRTLPWRHVAAVSGAFPRSLSGLPRGIPNQLHRWDAALWHKVAGDIEDNPPDFGDYGVSHAVMPKGGWRSDPNLRYTVGDDWYVYIAARKRPGNDDFFTICADLLRSSQWPAQGAATSWGDAQIALCGREHRTKAGGPTEWRAWATSHHLATVTDGLRAISCS